MKDSNFIGIIKSRRMRWAVHVGRMGEKRIAVRLLVGKTERRKDNFKINLVGTGLVVWTGLAWLRVGTSEGLL
jgi:hypothetical protein